MKINISFKVPIFGNCLLYIEKDKPKFQILPDLKKNLGGKIQMLTQMKKG